MSKPSEHVDQARKYQAEADSLVGLVDWNNVTTSEATVNCLFAIQSRLAAQTEAVLATVPYPILANAEEKTPYLPSPGVSDG